MAITLIRYTFFIFIAFSFELRCSISRNHCIVFLVLWFSSLLLSLSLPYSQHALPPFWMLKSLSASIPYQVRIKRPPGAVLNYRRSVRAKNER